MNMLTCKRSVLESVLGLFGRQDGIKDICQNHQETPAVWIPCAAVASGAMTQQSPQEMPQCHLGQPRLACCAHESLGSGERLSNSVSLQLHQPYLEEP